MPFRTRNLPWVVFLGAVAIRWSYDLIIFAAMGNKGLMTGDSRGYLETAQEMATQAMSGSLQGWEWLGLDLAVMPIYPWILAIHVMLFGDLAPLAVVMSQGFIDGATCLLIYLLAISIRTEYATPAAIVAAINPTMIVLSGLILTDTLFVFLVTLSLVCTVAWLRHPSWLAATMIGIAFGLSALARVLVFPFVPVLAVALITAKALKGDFRGKHVAQIAATLVAFSVVISPILARNVTQFGSWSLTSQSGTYVAQWLVPLVFEAKDGTSWESGADRMAKLRKTRFGRESNPFVQSQQLMTIAREELIRAGVGPIVKAWTIGAAINLAAPAIILAPPISQLQRTGFYATSGQSMQEKIFNFVFRSDNVIYAWALLLGIAGVAVIRLIQIAGVYNVICDKDAWPVIAIFVLWMGFILAVNGPIASPKYRLPIEPVLCVLTGAGIQLLRRNHGPPHQRAA